MALNLILLSPFCCHSFPHAHGRFVRSDLPRGDTMIAAKARLHGLTVATRNVDDLTRCGVSVVNPFE
jgi:predicted nucleic acid-binding protein